MNVLIVTPLYYIEGRENLFHDSSAIHYLVRPWAKEHNVMVALVYNQPLKKIVRYLDKKERTYYKNGYFYEIDNVRVCMCEYQRGYKQPPILNKCQGKRVSKFIKMSAEKYGFEPDIIVSHVPVTTTEAVKLIFQEKPRMAVFHSTDMRYINNKSKLIELQNLYDTFYCRSKSIYDYFNNMGLENMNKDILCSGVPSVSNQFMKKELPRKFKILYAGKLIKRKHIENVIEALSQLQKTFDFCFDIYGEGEEKDSLKLLAHEMLEKDKYLFHPFVQREEVLKHMSQADVFVMPSTHETLGLVYIEAMSVGCIPIGTKGEGIDGVIVDKENGYLVEAKNVENLKKVFEVIFSMNAPEYNRMRFAAYSTGQRYNETDMGQHYLKCIADSMERRWSTNGS